MKSQCRLFADDALVYATRIQSQQLQTDLNTLEKWAKTWQMNFNPKKKCFHLAVGKTALVGSSSPVFSICGQGLERVSSNPYLGVELQSDLKWNVHISQIEAKAKQKIGMIRRVLRDADLKTRMIAYTSLVRPGLEYGCAVWDPYFKNDITVLERTQNLALRFIFGIRGRVSFTELRKDKAIDTPKDRRTNIRMRLFDKIGKDVDIEIGVKVNVEAASLDNDKPPAQCTRFGQYYLPFIKTDQLLDSFLPCTVRDIRYGNRYTKYSS